MQKLKPEPSGPFVSAAAGGKGGGGRTDSVGKEVCFLLDGMAVRLTSDNGEFHYWINSGGLGNLRTNTTGNAEQQPFWKKRLFGSGPDAPDYFALHNDNGFVIVNERNQLEIRDQTTQDCPVEIALSDCSPGPNADNRLFEILPCPSNASNAECAGNWLFHLRTCLYVRVDNQRNLVCGESGNYVIVDNLVIYREPRRFDARDCSN